jgi:hypothetical protein
MTEILARTFIIAFFILYSWVFLALAGWSIRRALRDRRRKIGMIGVIEHSECLGFLHHARSDWQQIEPSSATSILSENVAGRLRRPAMSPRPFP